MKSNKNISKDIVSKHEIHHLDTSLLPKENASFQALTEDLKIFLQNLDVILKL